MMRVDGSRWRGLRVRVALLTILVAGASVAAMAWYASQVSVSAWRRQLRPSPPQLLSKIAREVADAIGEGEPDWRRAQRVLIAGIATTGKQLIVFDSSKRAVAAAPAELLRLDVSLGPDGAVTWQRVVSADDLAAPKHAIVRQRVIMGGPGGTPIPRPSGAAPAVLVELATPLSLDDASDPPLVSALRRSLLVGLAVAIAGAVLVALVLSARVAAPIERLTHAVRLFGSSSIRSARPAPVPESGSAEVAELSRAFNGMVAELDRQESLRRGMTSDIAHELRTPLTNMRCQIESMIDGLTEPTPDVLASLHEESLGLQRLIDDLQDMAYGDQGRLTLDVQPIEVAHELDAAVRPFHQRAAGAATTLRVEVSPEVPRVAADPRRLRQVVGNLVANALTHTSGGQVVVAARAGAGRTVAFEVRDTGAGIPSADVPDVFERFYRADPARARAGGGAGLGLAIVKQLVELQGGEVSIASEVGRGTTVRFTLPAA